MKPHFWFSGFNHSLGGRETLHDIMFCIAGQLRDMGFSCGRDETKVFAEGQIAKFRDGDKRFVNILFEGFHPGIKSEIERTKSEGEAKFICIMTEQPGIRGFNDSTGSGQMDTDMRYRQKFFTETAHLFDAILCLVPGAERWARRFNPHAVHMETGFSQMRHDILGKFRRIEPTYDIAFFGGITLRRHNIIQQLKARGLSVVTPSDIPMIKDHLAGMGLPGAVTQAEMYADTDHRNMVVGMAKSFIELKPNPKRQYPSSTRLNVGLHCGRPGIVEKHPIDTVWKQVVPFATGYDDFFNIVAHVVDNWQIEYATQLDRFQRVLSADNCVGKAFRETQLLERIAA